MASSPPIAPALRSALRRRGDRPLLWSFAGDPNKADRRDALAALAHLSPHHVHTIAHWFSSDSLGSSAYRDLLLNSTFVVCPAGVWNVDSYRVSEALEAGALPVVMRRGPHQAYDYWAGLFGPAHPLLVADSWDGASATMSTLASDAGALAARRATTTEWWEAEKERMRGRWLRAIERGASGVEFTEDWSWDWVWDWWAT